MQRILAATASPSSTRWTSLSNVKAVLGQFAVDAEITRLIDQVSGELSAQLGYPEANQGPAGERGAALHEAQYSETIRLAQPASGLLLSRRFLLAAPSVTEDGVQVAPGDIAADYAAGILYRLDGGSRSSFEAALTVVTYAAGFKSPEDASVVAPSRNFPPELERAAIDLIAYRWTIATGKPCGAPISQVSLPGAGTLAFAIQSPAIVNGAPEQIARIIAPYQFPSIGWR